MIGDLALALLLASGARPPLAAAAPGVGGSGRATAPQSVKWEKNFDEALRKARRTARPVIVDFWAEWCAWCDRLDRTTYVDPVVVQRSQDFVAAKVDTEGSRREIDVAVRYDVTMLPTILFLSPEGRQLWRVNGFQGATPFAQTMESALAIARNVIVWEQELAQNPDDPHALGALGAHLYEIGTRFYQQQCLDEARELLKKAVPRDGDQPPDDRRRTRMRLAILLNMERNYAQAEKLVKDALSLAPKPDDEPQLLFVLGRTYVSWGRPDEGIATMQIILQQYPQSPVAPKARETIVNLKAH